MKVKNLFSFVAKLGGVKRFSLIKQVHAENVLEHTAMVVIFALMIAEKINRETPGSRGNAMISTVAKKAAFHDFDEAITGDVVRPTKYASPNLAAAFKDVEQKGMLKIEEFLDYGFLVHYQQDAKKGDEGHIIALADAMAAAQHVWEEIEVSGNKHMIASVEPMIEFITNLQHPFSVIPEEHRDIYNDFCQQTIALLRLCLVRNPLAEMSL